MQSERVIKDMRGRKRVVWYRGIERRREIYRLRDQMGKYIFSLFVPIAARCVLSLCSDSLILIYQCEQEGMSHFAIMK